MRPPLITGSGQGKDGAGDRLSQRMQGNAVGIGRQSHANR